VPLPDPEVLPEPDVLPEPEVPEPDVLPEPEVLPEPLVLPVPDPDVEVLEVPDAGAVPSLLLPPHPAIHSAAVISDTRALDCCTFFIGQLSSTASMDRFESGARAAA
jgi:hypothetical protein